MKSVYIHIPFCDNICSYCDFSKIFTNHNITDNYLNLLEKEINENYKHEKVNTIYIGGGTPSSLNLNELEHLFKIVKKFNITKNLEFTIECNPENTSIDKIKLFKKYGVNRVSIGVQSFNDNILKLLERKHNKTNVFNLINNLKNNGISNINIDLIFGIKDQTLKDIENDLNYFCELDIPHLSYYSLILEENTKLYINKYIEEEDDIIASQYDFICKKLKEFNYIHYEISNFAKKDFYSIHNLTYWNNNEYYGFGLSSHGYINGYRYENTKSITKYLKGKFLINKYKLSKKEAMENELILGLRKLNGIDKLNFKKKFKKDIEEIFNISDLINTKQLNEKYGRIYINEENFFISNEILVNLLLNERSVEDDRSI